MTLHQKTKTYSPIKYSFITLHAKQTPHANFLSLPFPYGNAAFILVHNKSVLFLGLIYKADLSSLLIKEMIEHPGAKKKKKKNCPPPNNI